MRFTLVIDQTATAEIFVEAESRTDLIRRYQLGEFQQQINEAILAQWNVTDEKASFAGETNDIDSIDYMGKKQEQDDDV